MKMNTPTIIAAVVLIGLGGFMAGRLSTSPPAADAAAANEPGSRGGSSAGNPRAGGPGDPASRRTRTERGDSSPESRASRLAQLESIVSGEDPLTRNRALMDMIDQLGPDDFATALTRFRELGFTESRLGEYSLLLSAWANVDPIGALDYADKNTTGKFARETVLTAWATNDPDGAIRWAKQAYTGAGANPFLPGIIRGLAGTDPARATELLTSLPASGERGDGLDYLLPHVMQQGPEATRAWIASLDDEGLKDGAMVKTARTLADSDPAGTVDWLLATPGEAAQRRIDDTFGIWVTRDKEAAMAKFNEMPIGEARTDALRGMVGTVAATDPSAALEMLNRYPDDVTDKSLGSFIKDSLEADPTLALNQIPRIQDEKERDKVQSNALLKWLEKDPVAAQSWLDANPVSEGVVERMGKRKKGVR